MRLIALVVIGITSGTCCAQGGEDAATSFAEAYNELTGAKPSPSHGAWKQMEWVLTQADERGSWGLSESDDWLAWYEIPDRMTRGAWPPAVLDWFEHEWAEEGVSQLREAVDVIVAQGFPTPPWPADKSIEDAFGERMRFMGQRVVHWHVAGLRTSVMRGHWDEAQANVIRCLGIIDAMGSDAMVISQMMASSREIQLWRELGMLAGDTELDGHFLDWISSLLAAREQAWIPVQIVLAGEVMFSEASGEEAAEQLGHPAEWAADAHEAMLDASALVLKQMPDTISEVGELDLSNFAKWALPDEIVREDYVQMARNSVRGLLRFRLERRWSVNNARLVVAIERYRLTHGEPPASVDALVPEYLDEVPIDLAWGGAYEYRRSGEAPKGYEAYSRGLDGIDDGGGTQSDDAYQTLSDGTDVRLRQSRPEWRDFDIDELMNMTDELIEEHGP